MSEWIKSMGRHAKKTFGESHNEGDLRNYGDLLIAYIANEDNILIRGNISIDQLNDLVNHMNKCKGE